MELLLRFTTPAGPAEQSHERGAGSLVQRIDDCQRAGMGEGGLGIGGEAFHERAQHGCLQLARLFSFGHAPRLKVEEVVEVEPAGLGKVTRVETPFGELREVQEWLPDSFSVGWTERFVKSWRDLKALRYLYEHTRYEPDYEPAARRYELVGDNGLVLCYLPRSPFMQLVALDAGIEAVTYALADAPEELEETLAVIGRKHDEASEIALRSPAECLMIPENLSSEVVGKRLYGAYVRPHDERWTRRIREAGKPSFLHIDGTLRGLIGEAAATGFKVLEAVTPAPVGDIEVEDLHRWVGPETILWGGLPGSISPTS